MRSKADGILDQFPKLKKEMQRVDPLGTDAHGNAYYYFPRVYRLYVERPATPQSMLRPTHKENFRVVSPL